MKRVIFIYLSVLFISACRNDIALPKEDFNVNVRIHQDPQRINPIFASGSLAAREIYPYVFLQLAEFDPKSLEFSPILATEIPQKEMITSGAYAGGESYTFEILEEAVWSDGQPIVATDYLFTLKAIFHPVVNASAFRNYIDDLDEILIDDTNPKKFTLVFSKSINQVLEIFSSLEFFPEHIYDPNSVLAGISLADLRDQDKLSDLKTKPGFSNFAQQFNDVRFQIDNCVGSGPYTLDAWETDQFVKISRQAEWWGGAYPERTFLQAGPEEIIFHIIPDEITAITQLKSGQIDFMSVNNGENYANLIEESPDLDFHRPQLFRTYYIAMNNKSPKLDDKRVRRAISHLVDVDGFIDQMEFGQAARSIGVIPPFKEEYNKNLKPLDLDVQKSIALLEEAGWRDTNDNGIRDKMILGQRVELELDMFVTAGLLGQRLSLLLNEKAEPIGVGINIVQKTNKVILTDHLLTGKYDLYPMALQSSMAEYQAYNRWHSDNAVLGGSNVVQYSNPEADRIIEQLEQKLDATKRIQLYKDLQSVMYEDQPVVFLYSPLAKLVSSPRLNPLISVKRPGYFLQTAQVEEQVFSDN